MALVPPYVAAMEPYMSGLSIEEVRRRHRLERVVKLASNENPLGPSPLAVEAGKAALSASHRYPDAGLALRATLAGQFNVRVENVIAGAGSEGIMADIVRTFLCDEDEVLASEGTFPGMRVLAQARGVKYRAVAMRGWDFDLLAIAAAITPHTKLIFLPNPNNPTGRIFTKDEFDAFYARVPERVLIILDEAYFEYAQSNPRYPDSMHYRYDNVITLRTFSKAYGLAGLRIGYGFAHESLISALLKVKLPFEPSSIAEAAGIAALSDREFLHRTLENNARGMRFVMTELQAAGVEAVPSEANFVLTLWRSEEAAANIAEALLRAGVIVRPMTAYGVPNGIRISIGAPEENELLVEALSQAIKNEEVLCSR